MTRGRPRPGAGRQGGWDGTVVPVCTHSSIWRKLPARRPSTRLVRVFVPRPFKRRDAPFVRVFVNRRQARACVCARVCTRSDAHAKPPRKHARTHAQADAVGYERVKARVCAQPPLESWPAHWRPKGAFWVARAGLTTPSRGGTNTPAFAVPLGPTVPPRDGSSPRR